MGTRLPASTPTDLLLSSFVDHLCQRWHPSPQLRGKLRAVHGVETLVDLVNRVQRRVVPLLVDVNEGIHYHVHDSVALRRKTQAHD